MGPSVEFPLGLLNAVTSGGRVRAGHWSSLWAHEALYWVVVDACGRCPWGLGWSSQSMRPPNA
eukprot:2488236-Pyramimonas_sp.AAC.1